MNDKYTPPILGGLALALVLGLSSCYDRLHNTGSSYVKYDTTYVKKEKYVDLRDILVPEEGGTRFTKFTDENENVVGPKITTNNGVIEWYAPGFISVSPDGKRIAYVAENSSAYNIYIKNTGGGKQTIQRTFRNNVLDMAFSNDGNFIAFTEKIDEDYNIYQINSSTGTAVQQLTTTANRETSPCYSPDDNQVYFTKSEYSSQAATYRHYMWSYDRKTALLTQYSEGFTPSVTRDGKVVALTRNNKETGRGEIWTVDLNSGQTTQILSDREMGFSTPRISPDGKYVLCVGSSIATKNRRENLDIYVVKVDGSGLTQLTFHPGHDCSAVWSPDGKSIYFLSQRGSGDVAKFAVWQMDFKAQF